MEASEFQNASLQCDRDHVGAITGVELRQDAADVRFDGALGEFVTQSSTADTASAAQRSEKEPQPYHQSD
jgi:hypothetical protein